MSESKKKTILLVWGYQRKGWIEPFEKLKSNFNFVYLHFITPEEETACFTDCKRIYWSSYESAKALLDDIKPSKVVFMSLYNGLDIALNVAARNKSIPTYILQHGMFTTYADYRAREINRKIEAPFDNSDTPKEANNKTFSTLSFFKNSISGLDYLRLLKFPIYYFLQKRESSMFASKHVRFKSRIPDYFICYTYKNAKIHFELDSPDANQIILVGNPEFDNLFIKWNELPENEENYYLHIDQAFAGNRFGESIVTKDEMINFWNKLNSFCKSNGAKLKVKLHPENFKSEWLPKDENIDWIRETSDMVSIIKNSKGCFGFFSTLLIPAVYYKKTILFKMSDSDFQQSLINMGMIDLLDFYTFQPSDIKFEVLVKNIKSEAQFVEDYFFKTDGKATLRLQNILEAN